MWVEVPGKLAHHLAEHASLGDAEREALRPGRQVRRGNGYSLHVTAAPAECKAYRIYAQRLASATRH